LNAIIDKIIAIIPIIIPALKVNFINDQLRYLGHIGPLCETCDFLGENNYFEIG